MIVYKENKFIYPPRPQLYVAEGIDSLKNENWVYQKKLNDTRSLIIYNPESGVELFTRHGEHHKQYTPTTETIDQFLTLDFDKSKFQVFDSLLLHNKSPLVKNTWVLMDWLVKDGEYLMATTFKERDQMLESLVPFFDVENATNMKLAYEFTPKIWKAISYEMDSNFESRWNQYKKIWEGGNQMMEGFVLKNVNGKLGYHFNTEKCLWAFKVRYECKKYKF